MKPAFHPMLALLAISAVLCLSSGAAQASPKAPKPAAAPRASLANASEVQDVIRAMRSIEAKVASGINHGDYSREVGELTVTVTGLDELLEARKQYDLRTELAAVQANYQAAKDLWGSCVSNIRQCRDGVIYISGTEPSMPAFYAKRILQDHPNLNRDYKQGGALATIGGGTELNGALRDTLLSKLWGDAAEQGKNLRSALR